MREICTSGLMSGEGKRNASRRVTAPFLDSTVRGKLESNESFMIPWGGLILEGVAHVDE
jgi:hypothetical protein